MVTHRKSKKTIVEEAIVQFLASFDAASIKKLLDRQILRHKRLD